MFLHFCTTVRLSVCLLFVRSTVVSSYRLLAHLIPSLSFFLYRPCSRVLCKRRACPAILTSSPGSWSGRNNWKCACRVWDIRLSLDCSYPLHICIRVSRLTLKLPLSKTILLNIVISILHEAYQVDSTCVCLCGCTHMHMHNVMLFTTHAPVYKVEISSAKTKWICAGCSGARGVQTYNHNLDAL